MIISRTPFRMSFFGGGTDYPVWFREHGGAVLVTTINKYCYISCRYLPPFFDHRSRIVYAKVEMVKSNAAIEHAAVRGTLKYLQVTDGVEIHHDGDLPARTGLGSSSAFTVGLLHALYALKQQMPSKMQLAREAIHIEQEVLRENVGCQDQASTAFGGFSKIEFFPDGDMRVSPVIVNQDRLQHFQSHLLLYFTGFSRTASEVAAEQIALTDSKKRELEAMRKMVDEGLSILCGEGDLVAFGKLLGEGWRLKRSLSSKIAPPKIDEIYEAAKAGGAIGGKLLGAGGGGFMLLFARPEDHPHVQEKLKGLLRVPVQFENQGSQIVVYQPDADMVVH